MYYLFLCFSPVPSNAVNEFQRKSIKSRKTVSSVVPCKLTKLQDSYTSNISSINSSSGLTLLIASYHLLVLFYLTIRLILLQWKPCSNLQILLDMKSIELIYLICMLTITFQKSKSCTSLPTKDDSTQYCSQVAVAGDF